MPSDLCKVTYPVQRKNFQQNRLDPGPTHAVHNLPCHRSLCLSHQRCWARSTHVTYTRSSTDQRTPSQTGGISLMQRMLMIIAHHQDMVRAKPIAQIPDEHGMSPDVSQHLRLSDCWLSQDVLFLQHPTYTAYCLPFP